jgi:hypothetical protein
VNNQNISLCPRQATYKTISLTCVPTPPSGYQAQGVNVSKINMMIAIK